MRTRILALGLALSLILSACASSTQESIGESGPANTPETTMPVSASPGPTPTTTGTTPTTTGTTPTTTGRSLSPLAEKTTELESALYTPPAPDGPAPTSLTIDRLNVASAPVSDVGVLANGDMEVPPVSDVGWYRYGVRPGDEGSAVLAAHIAFDGVPGVFRHLDRLQPGDIIEVGFSDGGVERFTVTEIAQYDKDEIPRDRIFSKDGRPEIALITCGGDFNRSLRSYEDNIVAYAIPTP